MPRVIWLYWDEGEANAPFVPARCIRRWRDLHPDWDVRVLDEAQARAIAPDAFETDGVTVQLRSDLLRLELLHRFGGVWADATVYPTRRLDDWLGDYADGGFFAVAGMDFTKPLATWFIAARPGGRSVAVWRDALALAVKRRKTAGRYCAVHFVFDWCIAADPEVAETWKATPKMPFDPTQAVQKVLDPSRDRPGLEEIAMEHLRTAEPPLQKLNWRFPESDDRLDRMLAEAVSA